MSLQQTILASVDAAVVALGDLIQTAQHASFISSTHVPGADPSPVYEITDGRVALTTVDANDFPATSIEISDQSLMHIRPLARGKPGDFYLIGGRSFKVVKSLHTYAGDILALSQHLVRPEVTSEVQWA